MLTDALQKRLQVLYGKLCTILCLDSDLVLSSFDVFHLLYSVLVRHLYNGTLIFSLCLISVKSCNLLSVTVNLFFFLGLEKVKVLLRLNTANALISVCSVC